MKTIIKSILILMSVFFCSCQKKSDVTQEINKVETVYEGVGEKNEACPKPNPNATLSKTGMATDEFIKSYMLKYEKNQDLTTFKNELKSSSGQVGVIRSGKNCGAYATLEIWLDDEDDSNVGWITGWTGDIEYPGGNAHLYFCVVPDYFNYVTYARFAVLKLSASNTYSYTVRRFFDCEDDDNRGWINYNGTKTKPYAPWGAGTTSMDNRGNFDMYLMYYPYDQRKSGATVVNSYPSFGFSYGVFGNMGSWNGELQTTEEHDGNINQCYKDGARSTTTVSGISGVPGVDDLIYGYTGTNMFFRKIN
jgi:hypothetical protein